MFACRRYLKCDGAAWRCQEETTKGDGRGDLEPLRFGPDVSVVTSHVRSRVTSNGLCYEGSDPGVPVGQPVVPAVFESPHTLEFPHNFRTEIRGTWHGLSLA